MRGRLITARHGNQTRGGGDTSQTRSSNQKRGGEGTSQTRSSNQTRGGGGTSQTCSSNQIQGGGGTSQTRSSNQTWGRGGTSQTCSSNRYKGEGAPARHVLVGCVKIMWNLKTSSDFVWAFYPCKQDLFEFIKLRQSNLHQFWFEVFGYT